MHGDLFYFFFILRFHNLEGSAHLGSSLFVLCLAQIHELAACFLTFGFLG